MNEQRTGGVNQQVRYRIVIWCAMAMSMLFHGCGFDGSVISVDPARVADSDSVSDSGSEDNSGAGSTETATDSSAPWPDDAWRFFTISDIQNGPDIGAENIRSMYTLDPGAVALLDIGDLTDNALESEMKAHHAALSTGALAAGGPADHYRTDVSEWGNYTRVIAALGNHDMYSDDWLSLWNRYLPGQTSLGANSEAGVYFSVAYRNMLFIILDSNHPGPEQTEWLKNILASDLSRNATWKFAFYHAPVYSCSFRAPFGGGLPWLDLFEQYGVDMVVNGHLHTFERTCPLRKGICVGENDGGVVILTASGGGTSYARTVDENKVVTVSYEARAETYRCRDILEDQEDSWHHFCHYVVGVCRLEIRCYPHDWWKGGAPRHGYMLDKCR